MTLSHLFARQEDISIPTLKQKDSDSEQTAALLHDILDKPLEDRIRERAYELYIQRGRLENRADQDWHDAEEELLANR